MGLLYFEVEAKYDELLKLRREIAGLEAQMKGLKDGDVMNITALQNQLSSAVARMRVLTEEAAKSGQSVHSAFAQMSKVQTGIKYGGGAVSGAMRDAGNEANVLHDVLGGVNDSLGKMTTLTNGLGTVIGSTFGVAAIGSFIGKVQEVRSYFQDIESSMRVFLGDAEKADAFTAKLKDYAYYNMFEFSDLAEGAKQLIAYGNATEDIIPIMDKLSNVATGTGASLGELIGLYNKARSSGKVMARDVMSWASKGVVLRDELKAMGVEASEGAISFNQLNQVLEKVTGEGGRFHDLMMEQMDNLSASKGQLQDTLDAMYNEIGEKIEPILKGSIDITSMLVENYEKIGDAIMSLAVTYGTYRTVLALVNAVQKSEEKTMRSMLEAQDVQLDNTKNLVKANNKEVLSHEEKIKAIRDEIEAKKALARTDVDNLRKEQSSLRKILEENRNDRVALLGNRKPSDLSEDERKQFDELLKNSLDFKDELTSVDDKLASAESFLTGIEKVEASMTEMQTKNTNLLTIAKEKLLSRLAPLKVALTNPYVLAATAIAGAAFAIYKMVTAESAEERAIRKVSEEIETLNDQIKERKDSTSGYISALHDETKSLYEQADAYEKLLDLYPQLSKYSKEALKDMSVEDLNKEISEYEEESMRDFYESKVKQLKATVRDLEDAMSSQNQYTGTNTYAAQVGYEWEKAIKELTEYEKEYDKFRKAQEEDAFNGLSHEERIRMLEDEKVGAEIMADAYNMLYDTLRAVGEDDTKSIKERSELAVEATDKQVNAVEHSIEEIQKKIETANGEEKQRLQLELTKQEELAGKLRGIVAHLRKVADSQDPITLAFDFGGDVDRSTYGKNAQKAYKEFLREYKRIAKDSSLSESEKAEAYKLLYKNEDATGIIDVLTNSLGDMNNEGQKKAVRKLINDLKTKYNDAVNFMDTGIDMSDLGKDAKESTQQLNDLNNRITEENKNYGSYVVKLNAAAKVYATQKKDLEEMERKVLSGEKYDTKAYEELKENYEASKKSYETLLKERTKYSKQIEAERQADIKNARAYEDQQYEIRANGIKLMRDGNEKALEEARLNFEKQKTTIMRGYEDLRETRMKEAESLFNANPNKVGEFDKASFLENFTYTDEDATALSAKLEANLNDYFSKLENLSKTYQTAREKREERYRKAKEDVLSIEQTIAEIEKNMSDATRENGEEALKNLRERLMLARQIADTVNIDESEVSYYKENGNARQKKWAVGKDYDIRMAQTTDDWEIQSLKMERAKALNAIDQEILSAQADWVTALEGVGRYAKEYAKGVRDALETRIQSDEFKRLPMEEQKALYDVLAKVRDKIGGSFGDVTFAEIGRDAEDLKVKTGELDKALSEEKTALDMLIGTYGSVTEAEQRASEGDLGAQASLEAYDEALKKRGESELAVSVATQTLSSDMNTMSNAVNGVVSGLKNLSSGSLEGIVKGVDSIAQSFGAAPMDPTVAIVMALIDVIASTDADKLIDGIVDTICGTLEGLGDSVNLGRILQSIMDGVTNVFKSIAKNNSWTKTIDKVFGTDIQGSDFLKTSRQRFNELEEETAKLSEAFGVARSVMLEQMDELSGMSAVQKGREVEDTYRKEMENIRKLAKEYTKSSAGLFRHSEGYKEWEDMASTAKKQLKELGVGSISEIFDLDVDQMKNIMALPSVWSELSEETQGYIRKIVEGAEAVDGLADDIRTKLTGMTFDSMYDSFLSTMMNMDSTAYDVATTMSEYFYKAMMEEQVGNLYKSKLNSLYDEFADEMERGTISSERVAEFQGKYNAIVSDALKTRDRIAEMTGYDQAVDTQQASSKGFNAMSQEEGAELNGRFTALQMAGEAMRGMMEVQGETINTYLPLMSTQISALSASVGGDASNPLSNVIAGIHDTLSRSYLELREISTNTGMVAQMMDRNGYIRMAIDEIRDNTRGLKKR